MERDEIIRRVITTNLRRAFGLVMLVLVGLFLAGSGTAAVVLNEFNAVSSSKFLKNDKVDARLGAVEGNGGNWIELVVVEDHADIRGWQLWWAEESDDDLDPLWDEERFNYEQGIITFADNELWADLRSGTVITIGEREEVLSAEDEIVVSGSDVSFDPGQDDWWIHVWSFDTALVGTETNVPDDGPGNFSVGNDNWEIRLVNPGVNEPLIWGPIGEDVDDFRGAIQSDEVGKLEATPTTELTITDYNDGGSSSFGLPNVWSDGEEVQDFASLRAWAVDGAVPGFSVSIRGGAGGAEGMITLSWMAPSVGLYRVEFRPELGATEWGLIEERRVETVDAAVGVSVTTTESAGFFRVRLLP